MDTIFYMVNYYTYDGYSRHDQEPVIPCRNETDAKLYLAKLHNENIDMEWKEDSDGDIRLYESPDGKSQYEYAYYWIQEMEFGVEL